MLSLLSLVAAVALPTLGSTTSKPVSNLSALRAEADAAIAASGAPEQFVNDTKWDVPAVRHTRSGLRCLLEPGPGGDRLEVSGPAPGDRVTCHSRPVGFTQVLSAERTAPGENLDAVFKGSVALLRMESPNAQDYSGPEAAIRVETPPGDQAPAESTTGRYVVHRSDGDVFTVVSVALVDGWLIRQRFTAPLERAYEADMLAGVVMSTTLIDLAARKG